VRDYQEYPPVVFSLIGFRSHGKTVFLSSLLYEFNKASRSSFSYTPLDESGMQLVRTKLKELEQGKLPDPTPKVFFEPAILRVEGGKGLGNFHLLIYDTSGESLQQVSELQQYSSYVSRTPTILLLVSLSELKDATLSLTDLLTIYIQSVLELNGDPKKQTLVVVLTKGDRLVDTDGVPLAVRRFLEPVDGTGDELRPERLEALSVEIESWLERRPDCTNFVRRTRREFRQVKYCVISAIGSEPAQGSTTVVVAPRGVLAPLFWVVHLNRLQGPAGPLIDRMQQLLNKSQQNVILRDYRMALDDSALVAFCRKGLREPERLKALRDLSQGQTAAAGKLVSDYNRASSDSSDKLPRKDMQ